MSGQIADFTNVHVGASQNVLILAGCMAAIITKALSSKWQIPYHNYRFC
jgi:hypothetical protein